MNARIFPIDGERHGELTCTGLETRISTNSRVWRCVCDCGRFKDVNPAAFRADKVKTCGTHASRLAIETSRRLLQDKAKYPKGFGAGTKLYRAWRAMKSRCTVPTDAAYPGYGGSGVTLCAEWMNFEPFMLWSLSNGFGEGLTIDRIDTFSGYSPGNCRWVTMLVQARNKKKPNHEMTAFGETKLEVDWAEDPRCRVKKSTLRERARMGWNPEEAITKPAKFGSSRARETRVFAAFGESKSIVAWAEDSRCVVEQSVLRARVDRGDNVELSLTTPKQAWKGRTANA